MPTKTFPMQRINGSAVTLYELLSAVPDNIWNWFVLDFYGAGSAPGGRAMASFEEETRSHENGIPMTWTELNAFARAVDHTIDCLIIATVPGHDVSRERIDKQDFSGCEVVLEGFDSTEWTVWSRDSSVSDRVMKAGTASE